MLTIARPKRRSHGKVRSVRTQGGIVLIFALIVLVIMTLAAISLFRSTSSSNVIAGNLAFQQASTTSGDQGVESAIVWLENNNQQVSTSTGTACSTGSSVLACDQAARGYYATRQDPPSGKSWPDYWASFVSGGGTPVQLATDAAGNTVSYFIQRMCSGPGDSTSSSISCSSSPAALDCGNQTSAPGLTLNCPVQVYYRVTVRIDGPRNTSSYTQAMVAM